MRAEAQNQRNLATVSSFQTYAREFNLSSRDTEMISRWAISQDDTYILLYKDRRLALEAGWWGIDEESSGTESLDDLYDVITYPVYLRDGVFQAVVYDFSEAKLYDGVQIGAIALACVMFAIFMLIYKPAHHARDCGNFRGGEADRRRESAIAAHGKRRRRAGAAD